MARLREARNLSNSEQDRQFSTQPGVATLEGAGSQSLPSSRVLQEQSPQEQAKSLVPLRAEALPRLETPFRELEVHFDRQDRIFWQYMKPEGRPSYTMGLLREMRLALGQVERLFAEQEEGAEPPVRYLIMASRLPGIFNMGGDLPLFVELIRKQDHEGLRAYAYACIDVQYPRAVNLNLPVISISLVQGDALGGGFEAALADDIIVAERSAKFGLPEILFNLFPGMGAYSFLARKLNACQAERLILSGRIYSAEELHEMGVVDELVDDGMGEEAIYDIVGRNHRSFNARRAVFQARRMVNPICRDELISITDLWVDTALTLEKNDLRKMERLANAQDRRYQG